MKTIAYLRVSTIDQELDTQRLAILDYAHQHQLVIDEFVVIQASSRRNSADRGIDRLLTGLQPADTLLVSELSRLGRSLSQIVGIIDRLINQQVRFISIKESIELFGSQDIKNKVMVTMFGLFAEIERDLISERTKEGLAAARAKGKIIGRPKGVLGRSKLDGKEEEIRLLLSKEVSKSSIAKIYGVSRTALYHFIQTRKL